MESQLDRIEQKLDQLLRLAGHVVLTDERSGATIKGTLDQVAGLDSENHRRTRGDQPQFLRGEVIDI